MTQPKYVLNPRARLAAPKTEQIAFLNTEATEPVRRFFTSFAEYQSTPLVSLPYLAQHLGLGTIHIKDESRRFGLNAFKVLGCGFAIAQYIANRLGWDIATLSKEKIGSREARQVLGDVTFVSATDGNHGRGVAWAARQLGQKSVIYMPKGSSPIRLQNIRAEGADASITDMNYDEAVRLAWENSQKYGWIMVQDTAWDGYEDIPAWIMQGYAVMALEIMDSLKGQQPPTHVFLQAGVGSFAGAIQGFFAAAYGDKRPVTVIVEPDQADCLYRSAKAQDGKPHFVTGDMNTIMAGLACGEPNTISWQILYDCADAFVSCPDFVAANGMRMLGNPIPGDQQLISGESGAVTTGLLLELMHKDTLPELKRALQLDTRSRVLLISTEGDTDPQHYKQIVWQGRCADPAQS